MTVNDFVKQFESVFGASPAIRATKGEQVIERGDMSLLEMPDRVMPIDWGRLQAEADWKREQGKGKYK